MDRHLLSRTDDIDIDRKALARRFAKLTSKDLTTTQESGQSDPELLIVQKRGDIWKRLCTATKYFQCSPDKFSPLKPLDVHYK
jgi:hypothetical protein